MPDVRQIARERLSRERGYTVKDWGGRIPVAIVYPNSYYIGMSNLAVQTVYSLFNAYPDFVCERLRFDPSFFRIDRLPASIFLLDLAGADDTLLRRIQRVGLTGLTFMKV